MAALWPLQTFFHSYPEVLLSFIACCCFYFYYYYYFCRSSHCFSIPVNWPVVGMLPAAIAHFHHFHDYVAVLLPEAGKTFMFRVPCFLRMDFLITCDPANVHHVFNSGFANYPKGTCFAEIYSDVLGRSILCADGDLWRLQRKMAHGVTGDRAYSDFIIAATREKAGSGVLALLRRVAADGAVVDLASVFARAAYDITVRIVFGFDPESLSADFPAAPFSAAIDDFWEVVMFRHALPITCWKLLRWLNLGPEKKMGQARRVIDQFIAMQISEKKKEISIRERKRAHDDGLLTNYYMDQASGEEATSLFESEDKFLRDTAIFLMIAGRDAFGIGLSWLFFLLCKNPRVESKILDELRAHAGVKEEVVFDAEEVGGMVYLHGAVLEALRLFPPVAAEHKSAVEADVLPSGHRVEAGAKVLFSIYAMGRVKEIWGEDCMEFKPERWISEGGKIRHVPAYKFMAFTSGPRTCLGKEIGLTQMKIVAATVVWSFQLELVEGHVVEPKNSGMIRMRNGMKVTARKRAH